MALAVRTERARKFLPTSRVICSLFNRKVSRSTAGLGSVEEELISGWNGGSKVENTPLYDGHVPITCLQRTLLAVGSSVVALNDPTRGDMIAVLGETTGYQALTKMHSRMKEDPTGREILRDKPIINSKTLDLDCLRKLPDGTFGREYIRLMDDSRITADSRAQVKYIDSEELAYVMVRYRQIHDFVHLLCGMSISVPHEIAVKWFEMLQTGLPMCALSSFFGPLRLSRSERQSLWRHCIPWALKCGLQAHFILNVYYEKHFEESLESLRHRLNIIPAPVVR